MRVLVFCDDLHHPSATVRGGMAPLASSGEFRFDWIEDASGWDPGCLADYDAVLLSKSNVCSSKKNAPWLIGRTAHALDNYVRGGGGLVAVHSGTAGYKDLPAVRGVLGGVFESHPPPCLITAEPLLDHPLVEGVSQAFTFHDEHYQMILDDTSADVFLRTRSIHGTQPAGWTRKHGDGQVVVITPGHFLEVWLNPAMQCLLRMVLRSVAIKRA